MKVSELIRLQYHRNSEGEYHCPVLCKVFTPHTHIVAIRGAGSDNKSNVYSFEAVNELLRARLEAKEFEIQQRQSITVGTQK